MLTTGEEFELLHVMQDVKNLSAIAGMGAISSIHDSIQNYPDLYNKFSCTSGMGCKNRYVYIGKSVGS